MMILEVISGCALSKGLRKLLQVTSAPEAFGAVGLCFNLKDDCILEVYHLNHLSNMRLGQNSCMERA